jgi:23S rRNA (uracil1939-C5)-methyltransferase
MTERRYPVKRNGEYEVYIERLAFGGSGVTRIDNYVIFVKDTIPGDKALIRIRKRKKSHAEAILLKLLEPSSKRCDAPCPYFKWCGGCSWQNLEYKDQLMYKREIVEESLIHLGGMASIKVNSVLPSSIIFGYRNKMEFSFSDKKWLLPHQLGKEEYDKYFALGLHVPGSFDKILHIDRCLLQDDSANKILSFISTYAQQEGLEPYGIKSHKGYLRFLVLRRSSYSGRILVNIVTAYEDKSQLESLVEQLVSRFPDIESIVNNINERPAQIAFGDKEIKLAGKETIREKIGKFDFHISANSFFQTNTKQSELLYNKVLDFSGLNGKQLVWDLYSGTGTIGLFLAQKAREVIGFELSESAVRDAEINAKNHNVGNISFIKGDILKQIKTPQKKPDIIITDPPRAGMHETITREILAIKPERIIYVSCNPTTLARDLAILAVQYSISEVQPVDMFPHTYHIETVVRLDLKPNVTGD